MPGEETESSRFNARMETTKRQLKKNKGYRDINRKLTAEECTRLVELFQKNGRIPRSRDLRA